MRVDILWPTVTHNLKPKQNEIKQRRAAVWTDCLYPTISSCILTDMTTSEGKKITGSADITLGWRYRGWKHIYMAHIWAVIICAKSVWLWFRNLVCSTKANATKISARTQDITTPSECCPRWLKWHCTCVIHDIFTALLTSGTQIPKVWIMSANPFLHGNHLYHRIPLNLSNISGCWSQNDERTNQRGELGRESFVGCCFFTVFCGL